jgi:ATP-dependent DNA helicase UvrD/PcrA
MGSNPRDVTSYQMGRAFLIASFKDKVARFSLNHYFDAVVRGETPSFSAFVHRYAAEGPSMFRRELLQLTEKKSAQDIRSFLKSVSQTKLRDWIPAEFFPRFVFIDLECSPYTGKIHEAAVLVSEALYEENQPQSVKDDKGLTRERLDEFFGEAFPAAPFLLCGHNVLNFDLPQLAALGVQWDAPVLDTLQLSLLVEPLRLSHRLGGEHTAASDVKANLQRLQQLDAICMDWPVGVLKALHTQLAPGGLRDYFSWVSFRRPKAAETFSLEQLLAEESSPVVQEQPSDSDWLQQATVGQIQSFLASPGELSQLCRPGRGERQFLSASRQTIQTVRQVARENSNSLLTDGLVLESDRQLRGPSLTQRLQGGDWDFQKAYLALWKRRGGKFAHELHPFIGIEPLSGDWEDLFHAPQGAWTGTALVEHSVWLHQLDDLPTPLAVLDLEDLGELRELVIRHTLVFTDPHICETVDRFLDQRVLKPLRQNSPSTSVLIDGLVRRDSTFVDLIEALENHPRNSANTLAKHLAHPVPTMLRVSESDGSLRVSVCQAMTDTTHLRTKLSKLLNGSRLFTSCGMASPLLERLCDVYNLARPKVTEFQPMMPCMVAEDGSFGSFAGMPRTLVLGARWLLGMDSQHRIVMGLGASFQLALAASLRMSGQDAHHSKRYGSQAKTIQRTEDQPAPFIMGWNATALPPTSKHCLMTRLPFPSRTHPEIELAAAIEPEADLYQEVVLPMMIRRLARIVAILRAKGINPIILDRRVSDFGFHREIEATIGTIQMVPIAPADQTTLGKVREKLKEKLLELELSTPRQLFARVDPLPILRRILGPQAEWRGQQEETVSRILAGEDILAVLPTGSGKSLCFQVPALVYGELADRLTIVFSPLRALMRDQVQNLRRKGVQGVDCYHGELTTEERQRVLRDVRNGWTVMLYLAPEQLLNPTLLLILKERGVALVVVDEAHCLSEWGHDFRPEYQKIQQLVTTLESERAEARPQVIAFTATATKMVQKELIKTLRLDPKAVVMPLKRDNLHPVVEPMVDGDEAGRLERIARFIEERQNQPGLIYATTRKETEVTCGWLQQRCASFLRADQIGYLHSRVENRPQVEADFLLAHRPTRILVCTTAFGMGIDKSDIGWIIHRDAPGSLESYAQEIGRAGRDSSIQASLLCLVSPQDLKVRARMSDPLEEAEVELVLDALRQRFPAQEAFSCDIATLASNVGFAKEERAKVAMFALERAGILSVDRWSIRNYWVEPGSEYQNLALRARLSSLESRLLTELEARTDHPMLLDCESLAVQWAESWGAAEIERAIKGLIDQRLLAKHRLIRVTKADPYPKQLLAEWDELEMRLADALQARFEEAGGRVLNLRFPKLLEDLGSDGSLEKLERLLCWWRARRLIFQNKGLLEVRLARNQHRPFLAGVEADQSRRREALRLLETRWEKDETVNFRWKREMADFLETLSMLEVRNVIHYEDEASWETRLRIRFLVPPEQDVPRLRSLDLAVKRKSARYRQKELERFLSEARQGEEVWRFLQAYFDRATHYTPETEIRQKRIVAGLTQQQEAAVIAERRQPLLINAGAGTGKTHVLARRLLLLQAVDGIDPSQILALSFSRAGAAAIGKRVEHLAKELRLSRVRSYTFHSFCYQLIQMFGDTRTPIAFKRADPRLVENNWEANKRLNGVLADFYSEILSDRASVGSKVNTILAYSQLFDSLRSGHPQLERLILEPTDLGKSGVPKELKVGDGQESLPLSDIRLAFQAYLSRLHQLKQVDYAGMITSTLLLLRKRKAVRLRLQSGIKHLLVDEFQDTSRAQEEIIREIVGPSASLTVVGDSDQTIYTFNGSDVRNILEFSERNKVIWPAAETKVLRLEENFRSTPRILEVSNRLIHNNKQRLKKSLSPSVRQNDPERIRYRTSNPKLELFQTPDLDQALGAAFHSVDGWLQEGVKPHRIAVISRINPMGNPEKAALARLSEVFQSQGIPVARSARRGIEELFQALKRACKIDPLQDIIEPKSLVATQAGSAFAALHPSLLRAGLQEALQMGATTLQDWLVIAESAQGARMSDGVEIEQGVHLKTIHGVKGEEYQRVFVLHLADKFFPTARSTDIEEERRLLYVALTRAEELVAVSGESGSLFFEELARVGGANLQRRNETWSLPCQREPEPTHENEEAVCTQSSLRKSAIGGDGRLDKVVVAILAAIDANNGASISDKGLARVVTGATGRTIQARHFENPLYGSCTDLRQSDVRKQIKRLIAEGLVQDEYPSFWLTELGRAALEGQPGLPSALGAASAGTENDEPEAPDDCHDESEESDTGAFEAQIGQTNLMDAFRAWKGDS